MGKAANNVVDCSEEKCNTTLWSFNVEAHMCEKHGSKKPEWCTQALAKKATYSKVAQKALTRAQAKKNGGQKGKLKRSMIVLVVIISNVSKKTQM